jgi:DNA-3-methyladenine glycosylase II
MAKHAEKIEVARKLLMKSDPVLKPIIKKAGTCTLKPQRDHYLTLVRSIVSQQISTAAARTIQRRLVDHLHPHKITPETMARLDLQTLRTIGISQQKATYMIDLTDRVQRGELDFKAIKRHSDEQVIAELVKVKGIGVWTAHMFMIFSLGRFDVLPVGDLGIRNAIQKAYGLSELPKPSEIEEIAQPWRPYASIASWYLWRSLDNNG